MGYYAMSLSLSVDHLFWCSIYDILSVSGASCIRSICGHVGMYFLGIARCLSLSEYICVVAPDMYRYDSLVE